MLLKYEHNTNKKTPKQIIGNKYKYKYALFVIFLLLPLSIIIKEINSADITHYNNTINVFSTIFTSYVLK